MGRSKLHILYALQGWVGVVLIVNTLKDLFRTTKCTLKFESKYPMGIKPFHTILFNYFYYQVKHIAWKSICTYFHSPIK